MRLNDRFGVRRHAIGLFTGNVAPINVFAPVISGSAGDNLTVGDVVTISYPGAWRNSPASFTNQFYADDVAVGSAGPGLTFTLTGSETGKSLKAGMIGTNVTGSSPEKFSNVLGPVAALPTLIPVLATAPVISGVRARQGYLLTVSDADFSNGPWTLARRWLRDGAAITGETGSTYMQAAADIGHDITCGQIATNAAGPSIEAVATSLGTVTAAIAPTNNTAPSLIGDPYVGSVITCIDGTYTADPPATITRQFKRDAVAITGEINPTHTNVTADLTKTITATEVASNAGGSSSPLTTNGIGPISAVAPTLDTSVPAPILSLAVLNTTYPPQYDVDAAAQAKVGTHSVEFVVANAADTTFASPIFDDVLPISDAELTARVKLDSSFAAILAPALTNARARWRWLVSGSPYCSAWSNVQGHGGVSLPTITSSSSLSSAELSPVLQTITANTTCTFALTGADAAKLEKVGTEPASSIQIRLLANGIPDFEDTNLTDLGGGLKGYSFNVTPTNTSGQDGAPVPFTLSITDKDEIANTTGTFTTETGAVVSTVYTSNAVTVAGLDTGVSVPVVIAGSGFTYSKNGGAYTAAAGSVVNGDTLAQRGTSSSSGGTGVTGTLTIGDISSNQVARSYTITTAALTATNAALELGDSNTGPGFGLFSELPTSFFADDSANASKIYDSRLSGAIVPLVAPTSAVVTMTVPATPCVVTHNAHGKAAGTPVVMSTTGALATGVTAGNELFVANPTANTYQLATTYANAIAGTPVVASSGSQSGTHTATYNCGIALQGDYRAVNLTANLGRTSCGKYFEYIKQLRIDQASERMDRVTLSVGSSRFSDASSALGRAGNWSADLTDGCFHDLQVQVAAYTAALAAEGKYPNWKFVRFSGPANGIVDNTETAAFGTKLTALFAGVRTIVGNSALFIVERVGNAQNQAAFASFAANVATVRAAQASCVAAEIAAGRPAVMTNADGFVASDSPTLHWSAGSHNQSERQIYCEVAGLWYPTKYGEANQPTHEWTPGEAKSFPWPPTTLSSAWDNNGGALGLPFQQATSSKQPSFVTAALANGYPTCRGIQGDGVDDVLFTVPIGAASAVVISPNADWCLWGVISGPATANKAFFGMGGAGANPLFYFGTKADGSGKLIVQCRDDANGSTTPIDSGLVLFDGAKHFFCIWRVGNVWNFQVDATVGTPVTQAIGTTTLTKSSLLAANSSNGVASLHMAATIWKLVTAAAAFGSDAPSRANARGNAQRFHGAP